MAVPCLLLGCGEQVEGPLCFSGLHCKRGLTWCLSHGDKSKFKCLKKWYVLLNLEDFRGLDTNSWSRPSVEQGPGWAVWGAHAPWGLGGPWMLRRLSPPWRLFPFASSALCRGRWAEGLRVDFSAVLG